MRVKNIRAVQDGVTLCSIISHFEPSLLDLGSINRDNRAQNMRNAYSMLTDRLQVPSILDFSDLIDSRTSDRVLMFFTAMAVTYLQRSHLQSSDSKGNDEEISHVKSKVQVIERKLDHLNATAQRLSSGFSLVVASGVNMEAKAYRSAYMREAELENHVTNLELKIEKLNSALCEQQNAVEKLLLQQDSFDKIIHAEPNDIDKIDDATLRESYIVLLEQNRHLKHQNKQLVLENEALKQLTSTEPPEKLKKRHSVTDEKEKGLVDRPKRDGKKKKGSTLRRKTASNIKSISQTLDRKARIDILNMNLTSQPETADKSSHTEWKKASSHSQMDSRVVSPRKKALLSKTDILIGEPDGGMAISDPTAKVRGTVSDTPHIVVSKPEIPVKQISTPSFLLTPAPDILSTEKVEVIDDMILETAQTWDDLDDMLSEFD